MKEHSTERHLLQDAIRSHQTGSLQEAVEKYRTLLRKYPNNTDALHYLGILECQAGNYAASVNLIMKSIELMRSTDSKNKNYANAINNLGNAYKFDGELDKALDAYSRALEMAPDSSLVLNNIGNVLTAKGQINKAMDFLGKAITLAPDYIEPRINLGNAYKEAGDYDEAIKCYEAVIDMAPGNAAAHTNLADVLLASGELLRGWEEYQWRWEANQWKQRPYQFPAWTGEALEGKNILIYAEQGIGDEIMFASCIPDLVAMANNVVVECAPRLAPLFSRSFPAAACKGVDRMSGDVGWLSDMPAIDVQVASGSLPGFLRNSLDDFPSPDSGYLIPGEASVRKWIERYGHLGTALNVGISWRGGTKLADKRARSISLVQWVKILLTPDVNFINLQYGECGKEIRDIRDMYGVDIHTWNDSDPLKDIDDFAGKIAALDLVISVDNSTVHLSASLGVETWVLQPYCGDWRWLRGNGSSYWYPSIRQFWQRSIGDWGSLLENVSHELCEYKYRNSN